MTVMPEHVERAGKILTAIKNDDKAFTQGQRNNDCVDMAIACRVLGINPRKWIEDEGILAVLSPSSQTYVIDKLQVLEEYMPKYGPEGEEEFAFNHLQSH